MEDFRRMIIKVSDVEGASATIPVSNDHTDGSWLITDIYEGELFLNLIDNILQTRTDAGIINLNASSSSDADRVVQDVRYDEGVEKGEPLRITGYNVGSGIITVERADASSSAEMPSYGLAIANYSSGATGQMIAVGTLTDVNTSAFSEGDTVYVAVGGGLTNVKPVEPNLIQNVGIVARSNANNGSIEVIAIGRVNDVPNLPLGHTFIGTATNPTTIDLTAELNSKQDTLVSGTNIKTINGGTILGSGDVATASVNSTSSFVPYNENGVFEDSPFEVLPVPVAYEGLGGFQTKMGIYSVSPGNVSNYDSFGVQALAYFGATAQSSVSLGDYGNSNYLGQFYWYTGSSLTYDGSGSPPIVLPFGVSGIAFNTSGYNLFESTLNYFKLDAKTGNPSRVDGLLFNLDAGGFGYGRGLENGIGSSEESIYWNLMTGDFTINGVYGMECFYNSPNEGKTYLSQSSYDLGIWSGAMYISDSLTIDAQPTVSTKILRVRDSNGNSFQIKLYDEQN